MLTLIWKTLLATVVVVCTTLAIYGIYLGVSTIKAAVDEDKCIKSTVQSEARQIGSLMDHALPAHLRGIGPPRAPARSGAG